MGWNYNSGYGQALLHAVYNACPTFGKVFIVCPNTDANFDKLQQIVLNDPDGFSAIFADPKSAYDACVSNRNDVILLSANSSHTITPFAWTKNRIHVVGLDGGNRLTDQGTKITNHSTDTAAFVLQITGTRNTFKNLKIIQSSTNAAALTVAQFGGEGNVYENCSFIFGVSNNLGSASAHEIVLGEDSGTFLNCEFGADTLLTTAARSVALIKEVTASQEFKSNRFRGCTFKISSSNASALFLKVNSAVDVLFTNLFENCNFYASVDSAGGIALTNAVASFAALVKGTLAFNNPASFNCTDFCAGVTDNFQVIGPVTTVDTGIGLTPS